MDHCNLIKEEMVKVEIEVDGINLLDHDLEPVNITSSQMISGKSTDAGSVHHHQMGVQYIYRFSGEGINIISA